MLTAATWASRSTGLRRPYRHGSLCRCRGCWRLSGLGRLLCGVSRSSCLNSTSPRVPITWEAYASAAGPALSASPRFLTWHTALSQGDPPAQAERYRRDFGPMLDRVVAIRKYLHHGRVQPQRYALRNSLSLKPLETPMVIRKPRKVESPNVRSRHCSNVRRRGRDNRRTRHHCLEVILAWQSRSRWQASSSNHNRPDHPTPVDHNLHTGS